MQDTLVFQFSVSCPAHSLCS